MSKEKIDTYRVECNCSTCLMLRYSMSPSCRGCSHRHNEVVDLKRELQAYTYSNIDEKNALTARLTLAEAVVKEAFEFAAGFGDTVGRVNISGLRKSLQAYDKGKGGE